MIREKFHERLKEIENRRLETMKRKEKELAEKKDVLYRGKRISKMIFYILVYGKHEETLLYI